MSDTSHTDLLPAERLALTVALSQVTEGRELLPNVGSLCVLALARITGTYDYTAHTSDSEETT